MATTKYLLWDERVVDRAEEAALVPGEPHKHGSILMEQDRLWEVRTDNMQPNVMYDDEEGLFKLWYSPFVRFQRNPRGRETALCYATSRDGLVWEKPILNLCPFCGTTANNILARAVHGVGVQKDPRDPDPSRRYKMIYFFEPETVSEIESWRPLDHEKAVRYAFSTDGIHWRYPRDNFIYKLDRPFGDTHNNFFWDERSRRYIGFTRLWDPTRVVGRIESEDFVHWTGPEVVVRALPGEVETYQPYAMPVWPYEGLYLGMVAMFKAPPGPDTVDLELAVSADTKSWKRPFAGRPLIPRGPQWSFDSHVIYGPLSPIVRGDEIWVYYAGCNGPHTGIRETGLGLAKFRLDGFAAWHADGEARLVTTPFACSGRHVAVNVEVPRGSLRVGILTADGEPIPGCGASECRPVTGDSVRAAIRWQGKDRLDEFAGRTVRLEFRWKTGNVYSFAFEE